MVSCSKRQYGWLSLYALQFIRNLLFTMVVASRKLRIVLHIGYEERKLELTQINYHLNPEPVFCLRLEFPKTSGLFLRTQTLPSYTRHEIISACILLSLCMHALLVALDECGIIHVFSV